MPEVELLDYELETGYLEEWEGYDLRDRDVKPPLPAHMRWPEEFAWVWLEAVSVGDEGYPAGFPSTTNEDLRRTGGRWVLTRGFYVRDWVETNCPLSDGRWIGMPFLLQKWQTRLVVELFEYRPDTGQRRYRWSLIGLPKKNGKTELAAALALFLLVGDHEPAPLVVAAAASDEQADLCFGAAKTMGEMSERLGEVLKLQASRITVPDSPRSRLQRVAAAAGTNDGKNLHGVVVDEFHEWVGKGEQVWNVLTNGLGAREEPLIIQITTAGSDEDTVCFRQYEHGTKVRDGTKQDPTLYFLWFEAPEGIAYDTEEAIASCNPSYGVTVKWAFFKDQLSKKTEAVYRRYFLNQWTESDEIWEAAGLWDGLPAGPKHDRTKPLFVATDVGLKHDSAAVVWGQWLDDALHVRQRIWLNPYPPNHSRYSTWRLEVTELERFLRELYDEYPESAMEDEDEYPLAGPAFFYDPHYFERSAQVLREDGLNMVEFPQTLSRLVPASQLLFELIKAGELVHDHDPEARRQIRSVIAKETDRGWRIAKPKGSRKHVDFAVALAMMALHGARLEPEPEPFNIW